MLEKIGISIGEFYQTQIVDYITNLSENPIFLISTILDIIIVLFVLYKAFGMLKETRAWQLLKGIAFLIIITLVSGILNLKILNFILSSIMSYGVIMLIIVFQPELRRGLEQLGTSKFRKFFGIDKDLKTKTKESIYKIAIASVELSKAKKEL